MKFSKLKFKEIINEKNNEIQYLINEKFVTKSTYDSLMNDDTLEPYVLPPLPKIKNSPENSSTKNIGVKNMKNEDENEVQCDCPECQELRQIISDIREMDDEEALDGLQQYLEAVKTKVSLETSALVYSELGKNMIKASGKYEEQLDNYLSQFAVEE